MQVVRFNPILCCFILRNTPHFFVSTSAIPVNRYPQNVTLSGKPHLSPDKLFKINQFVRGNLPSHGQIAFRESMASGIGAS